MKKGFKITLFSLGLTVLILSVVVILLIRNANRIIKAVVSFLKNNNNQIVFDFTLEGDLANPKFNLRQSFMEKLNLGIAEKLGLSVTKIGESIVILGAEGVKQVGKGIKGIGEGIKDIFK